MAIKMTDNGLVVQLESHTGYEDASLYIRSLLNIMQAVAENDRLRAEDVYYVCDLIHHLLPSHREFYELERMKEK